MVSRKELTHDGALPSGWWVLPALLGSLVAWGYVIWLLLR
jgi:hypothetical protein